MSEIDIYLILIEIPQAAITIGMTHYHNRHYLHYEKVVITAMRPFPSYGAFNPYFPDIRLYTLLNSSDIEKISITLPAINVVNIVCNTS